MCDPLLFRKNNISINVAFKKPKRNIVQRRVFTENEDDDDESMDFQETVQPERKPKKKEKDKDKSKPNKLCSASMLKKKVKFSK
ncbi:unnamed protein product [Acanthoscelides obtectus]|uniref:Uncharacterized protein n=1 Tax=Acanthoscelides obtectus TaxID=200917 RepID=A0A9P0QG95_ACAOB|nr:unnamed protein product [Acanthoscelides obtectus]CAK1682874.1 hypothetical protein AOBTE_LOCUS33953 [Acanthoscelides obtectus]